MLKKLLLQLVFLFAPLAILAQNFTQGDLNYIVTTGTNVSVKAVNKTLTTANIPTSVTNESITYAVTSIGTNAFDSCTGLTSVTIPNSVTSIENSAFFNCTDLTSVTIPNSVTSIGNFAFLNCKKLTTITIPQSVTSLGNSVFYYCSGLTSVSIPNSVTSIGIDTFNSCTALTSVTIPSSVMSIGITAFYNCSGLTSVTIPNSVTSIGNNAFGNCTALTSITIPNSVTSIGFYAFSSCTALTSIKVLNPSPVNIDANVFNGVAIANISLSVPGSSVSAYQAAAVWQDFNSITNIPQGTHLNFDGINDYVSIPYSSNFNFGTGNFSVECWVKTSNSAVKVAVGAIQSGDFWLGINNGKANFSISGGGNATGTTTISDGAWHHIVGVRKNGINYIYVDGALEGLINNAVAFNLTSNPVTIGNFNGSFNFQGNIDDVRIWNKALTASEISTRKNCELDNTQANLLAYYKFNQGYDQEDNSATTTLTDATSNTNNATLINFALNGTTSNWLAGSPVTTGSVLPGNPSVTTPVTYNSGDTASALTATIGSNGTGLVWYTTATGGTGSTTAPIPSTASVGSTSYWVSCTNAYGCESDRIEIVVTVNSVTPATHLHFDGNNDLVNLGSNLSASLNNNTKITLEAWIKPESIGTNRTIVGNYNNGAFQMQSLLRQNGSSLEFWIGTNTGFTDATVSNVLSANTWYHVAGTWDGTTMKLYINGNQVASYPKSGSLSTTTNNYMIGNSSTNERFHGSIDEVRIWNVDLSQADIQNTMNCELQNNQNNILGYYKLNQGFDSINNSSVTTATDSSENGNDGTLINFALTGGTSNWAAGSPISTGNTCNTLSNKDFTYSNYYKVYPNPSSGIFNIETKENTLLEVYDVTGRKVKSQKATSETSQVDLSGYNNGVYFLKTNQGTTKLIKKGL
ncbi:leucine-rich repeat protein [Flavobacterium sp. LM4]|uniref:leucine-rich repeat protein n=1 Tax=Flavobacterium sp. LM4 TaxID=1938609 RepID=UPI000993A641|nr:leucine-rich repeat protein [Flavobacterium sp. LM4]OOV18886.1 hypothetical protein BXU10_04180 [Flavobacterium sp. LM4]